MNDEQRSEFEDQARQVGRKKLPPEWRAGILDAALGDAGEPGASWEEVVEIVEPEVTADLGWLEGRIRKAERRAGWSMAACFVLTLILAALLFRPKSESSRPQMLMDVDSTRTLRGHDWRESAGSGAEASGYYMPSATTVPVASPAPVLESTRGVLVPKSPGDDTFELATAAQPENVTRSRGRESLAKLTETIRASNEKLLVSVDDSESMALGIESGNRDINGLHIQMNGYSESFREVKLDKPAMVPLESKSSTATLGQHSDGASWERATVAGDVFATRSAGEGGNSLERLADRRGTSLSGGSTVGGVVDDYSGGRPPTREKFESKNAGFIPLSNQPDDSLLAGIPINRSGDEDDDELTRADFGLREEALLRSVVKAAPNRSLKPTDQSDWSFAAAEQAAGEAPGQKPSVRKRRPFAINQGVSNSITEEVRYQIDSSAPAGESRGDHEREIGVTLAVTPSVLADGTVRMNMRPRSAQVAEEVIGQSGTRYSVSDSMREKVASVPPGHSLVVGGFYGKVKDKDRKVPLLGDVPQINLFFKNEEAAQEEPSLLFVVTPTTEKNTSGGKDRVVLETKVLKVNDWMAATEIGKLNDLIGNASAGPGGGGVPVASDGAIVLSAEQTDGVLKALAKGGLARQVSNPTLITEDNELSTLALIDRVPIITTTLPEPEPEPDPEPEVSEPLPEEPEKDARDEPWSTFSLNVSDVSFKLAKAALARGEWPAADQIRVEEFVNAFDYGDQSPSQEEKVACNLEQAAHPYMQQRNLLRVSMKTAALGRAAETPLRLTVLLDNSGSMDRFDRVESVKKAFQLLAAQLNPDDQVTLIGFARTPRLLADRLAGNRVAELADVVDATPSAGGTNLEEALRLGLEKAKEQMVNGAQNRIILLTDGAVNLGNAQPDDLANLVEEMRGNGIAFDACGVGADGFNDEVLETLTRKGDGRYYFLDQPEDADSGFARQIAGALRPAARNVKVQVKFNPERVGRYKLYGFNKHRLKKEDFRDDSVDAAELAAAEAGNAVYQFEALPEGIGDIGTVSVRFEDTASGRMIERQWTIPYVARIPRLEDAAASLRLASGAALLGEKLKGTSIGESVEMEDLVKMTNGLPNEFPADQRVEALRGMVHKARELSGE